MNKIPLRVYVREIEEIIDQKQIEEAIAHCRHILKIFPKHVETYRLLGKAYLESQRYGNASDIFQRVLSSVPNDFISNIGMSIIREDESNLDAAIWHMERAFESQPYNTAIQGELRRLYGQRDGMEPPKIRMTRGALAKMYAKSDLYDQAIAELRSSLAKEPNRSDLQIMLAEMYTKNGQEAEAIDVCSSLLQRLPFCFQANQILSELLPTGEREEELPKPAGSEFNSSTLIVLSYLINSLLLNRYLIKLSRLTDWIGMGVLLLPRYPVNPNGRLLLGLIWVHLIQKMKNCRIGFQILIKEQELTSTESESSHQETEGVPDWMQEAGWGPSTGEVDESASSFIFDEDDGEADEALVGDIPNWLQGIAPEGVFDEPSDPLETINDNPIDDDLPEWLSEDADGSSDTIITWLEEKDKTYRIIQ